MAEKKHRLLKAVGLTAATAAAAYAGTGYYIFRNAFDLANSPNYAGKTGVKRLSTGIGEKNEWFAHCTRDDEFLDSYDGLKLHALRITNHEDGHRWMVLQHGLCSYSGGMLDFLWEADHRGFNILAPDARGCGMSEGKYTGLGWNEHYDLISWINHLLTIDPQSEIVLFGLNAGAAAVMNATGDYIPANVKCAVEDGGFSGIREIILYQIREKLKVEGSILMPSVDLYVKQFLHFSMNDVSVERQLKQSVTPTLFVHGTEDDVVPAGMVFDNYYACAAEKDLFTVEGCGFAETYLQEGYFDQVFAFIEKYISAEE
ncbi:MAG: lysophospholipase [Solobacterium sp.]|nr:lysophospholipase [Solobacterium sp.]